MMHKEVVEMLSELKKIRGDMDKVQAYVKTVAEQTTVIAENTTPTPEPTPDPDPEPTSDSEPGTGD